jgi:hypothetical protein
MEVLNLYGPVAVSISTNEEAFNIYHDGLYDNCQNDNSHYIDVLLGK